MQMLVAVSKRLVLILHRLINFGQLILVGDIQILLLLCQMEAATAYAVRFVVWMVPGFLQSPTI